MFLEWCSDCGQKCCRNFGSYLTDPEVKRLALSQGTRNFVVELQSFGQSLNFLKTQNKHCVFLLQDGRCGVQGQKPMICKAYPLKYFREGDCLRWFVTMFCPAAKSFIQTDLTDTFREVKKEIKSWPKNWVQNLTSVGLLAELKDDSGDVIRNLLADSNFAEPRRNYILDGQPTYYRHAGTGLEIPLDNGEQLWVELEHRSYLQARLVPDTWHQPLNILATQLVVAPQMERLVTEFSQWGKQLFNGFRVVSVQTGALDVYASKTIEYQYQENRIPINGIRYFLIKDFELFNFVCEAKGSPGWKDVMREADETIKRFKFNAAG
jgi:Fe-S-cluster containining protein